MMGLLVTCKSVETVVNGPVIRDSVNGTNILIVYDLALSRYDYYFS